MPWKVQVHVAEADPWAPRAEVEEWRRTLESLGASVELHVYRAGHLFTDPRLPEFDDAAALAVWARAERFLSEPFVPVA